MENDVKVENVSNVEVNNAEGANLPTEVNNLPAETNQDTSGKGLAIVLGATIVGLAGYGIYKFVKVRRSKKASKDAKTTKTETKQQSDTSNNVQ